MATLLLPNEVLDTLAIFSLPLTLQAIQYLMNSLEFIKYDFCSFKFQSLLTLD